MLNIEDLLKFIVEKDSTDLHLTVGLPPQMRVNGELKLTEFEKLTPELIEAIIFEILSERQIQQFRQEKELDVSHGIPGVGRFRINLYYQRGSVGVAVRFIPYDIPSLEKLGIPSIVKDLIARPSGLFLVTGPTGGGKSTTLASMVAYINTYQKKHIITIEDPIEYLHKHKKSTVNQRELGTDTLSFQEALRHVFRQDPDVILIGEMRDLDTIHTALTLAETGHLIFATLHTSDAVHAISRIVDVFPPVQQQQIRVQLSMVLVAVMVQQLIPTKDGKGRVLAIEIMKVIPSIRNLIRENNLPQIYPVIQMGRKYGMITINQYLSKLCKQGIITVEEAKKHSNNVSELMSFITE